MATDESGFYGCRRLDSADAVRRCRRSAAIPRRSAAIPRDGRFQRIDIHASALGGIVALGAIIDAFVVEMARGHDGNPYTWLGASAGSSNLTALVLMRLRD